ncbi:phenylacetate-CoA ligase [Kibdelosporangium banguiense]|uniref:Phenylacetate-CoA ligase n=1 Tax=Kibdelosporangium banguiense TaxID=1365924 RepID=A0ABS4TLT8_9PSEU|nr:phenylacetate--CoA ligase family protein [Kibdelosporangium banguiense]MBP2325375.1 phenylacetate-CoA ligase [Kibdelosporangium banguiense]
MDDVVAFFHDVVASVPAYPKFLGEHGVDPGSVRTLTDFQVLPMTSKATYQSRYPLPELCRDGRIGDMIAVSSGSSGTPTIWPRSTSDELHISERFEQVFREFGADRKSTLAIVCFPLGTWVGGLFTLACVRHLAERGFPVTTVAPGNNKAEILRVFPELAPHFDQVVLLGYPPFVKDVIDSGTGWADHDIKMVFAGEVFSEEWRDLVASRGGVQDPVRGMASLYGTADAGVLGNETPQSVSIRRFLAGKPDLARDLFGDSRLPTLVQYDPASRFFEVHNGTLLFSGDNGVPLIRYHIADEGGVIPHQDMLDFCTRNGFTPVNGPGTPFVFVFGRSLFTVSFFGANIYPENVTVGLEQPGISDWVTGKFVLETYEDADRNLKLRITVELAKDKQGDPAVLAESIRDQLLRLNSEFAHYVPAERQLPEVVLRPPGDPEYFPIGIKHRSTRPAR